jgi:MFS family permease
VLFMVAVGQSFSHLDRQIVTILLPPIKAELHVSDGQLGLMSGLAFALFYAAFGVPIAQLADRWSRRNLMALAVVIWSTMTTLSGTVTTFAQLVLSRFGVGFGEAGYAPAAYSMLSDYFSRKQRQTATAIAGMGPHVGTLFGLLIGGLAAPVFGWRAAFFVAGVPGIIFGVVLFLTVKEPPRGLADGITDAPPRPAFLPGALTLWRIPSYRWLVIAGGLFSFCVLAQAHWMPSFLSRTHHMPLSTIGPMLGMTVILFAPAGTLLSGVLGDRLGRIDERLPLVMVAVCGLVAIPLMMAALLVQQPLAALALYGAGCFFASFHLGPCHALVQSTCPVRLRGLGASFLVLTTAIIGAGFAPAVVGMLSDAFAAEHGVASLRYAMAWSTLAFILPAIAIVFACQHLKRDLAAVENSGAPSVIDLAATEDGLP